MKQILISLISLVGAVPGGKVQGLVFSAPELWESNSSHASMEAPEV